MAFPPKLVCVHVLVGQWWEGKVEGADVTVSALIGTLHTISCDSHTPPTELLLHQCLFLHNKLIPILCA